MQYIKCVERDIAQGSAKKNKAYIFPWHAIYDSFKIKLDKTHLNIQNSIAKLWQVFGHIGGAQNSNGYNEATHKLH